MGTIKPSIVYIFISKSHAYEKKKIVATDLHYIHYVMQPHLLTVCASCSRFSFYGQSRYICIICVAVVINLCQAHTLLYILFFFYLYWGILLINLYPILNLMRNLWSKDINSFLLLRHININLYM